MHIEDYAFIGDLQTSALVRRDGSFDWLCLPHFDSPAVFARLLGTEDHGFWQLAPHAQATSVRRYRADSLILETEWATHTGAVRVLDFMPPRTANAPGGPQIIRIVQGIRGTVRMASKLTAVFDYGQRRPSCRRIPQAFGRTRWLHEAGAHAIWIDSTMRLTRRSGSLCADFTVGAAETMAFALTWCDSTQSAPPRVPDPHNELDRTSVYWTQWANRCTYEGPHRDAVLRSLLTLKGLTHLRTGAIVAAPTTSLPEALGGSRNWDYRFTWLRDAALTLNCLVRTGYLDEARAWCQWLLRAVGGDPDRLRVMYSIAGQPVSCESKLELPGYAGSRPVRVGNAAAGQLQLDIYGEVIDTLHQAHLAGLELDDDMGHLQTAMVKALEKRWQEPDEGIWEVRGPRRHFVHSKVMAWVAVDRTVQAIEAGQATGPLERWRRLRAQIHDEVCTLGYDPERNTFTQSYGSRELDAALLVIPLVGFLPMTDKRVIGTVEAIQRELTTEHGLVLRYQTAGSTPGVDGLEGDEGAFLACSFWLVECLVGIGRQREAQRQFGQLLDVCNDVGLLAEEVDALTGRHLGNFPQALSHVGVVQAALKLTSIPAGEHTPAVGSHLPPPQSAAHVQTVLDPTPAQGYEGEWPFSQARAVCGPRRWVQQRDTGVQGDAGEQQNAEFTSADQAPLAETGEGQ